MHGAAVHLESGVAAAAGEADDVEAAIADGGTALLQRDVLSAHVEQHAQRALRDVQLQEVPQPRGALHAHQDGVALLGAESQGQAVGAGAGPVIGGPRVGDQCPPLAKDVGGAGLSAGGAAVGAHGAVAAEAVPLLQADAAVSTRVLCTRRAGALAAPLHVPPAVQGVPQQVGQSPVEVEGGQAALEAPPGGHQAGQAGQHGAGSPPHKQLPLQVEAAPPLAVLRDGAPIDAQRVQSAPLPRQRHFVPPPVVQRLLRIALHQGGAVPQIEHVVDVPLDELHHQEVVPVASVEEDEPVGVGGLELEEEVHGGVGLQGGQRHVGAAAAEGNGVGHDGAAAEAGVELAGADVAVLAQVEVGAAVEEQSAEVAQEVGGHHGQEAALRHDARLQVVELQAGVGARQLALDGDVVYGELQAAAAPHDAHAVPLVVVQPLPRQQRLRAFTCGRPSATAPPRGGTRNSG